MLVLAYQSAFRLNARKTVVLNVPFYDTQSLADLLLRDRAKHYQLYVQYTSMLPNLYKFPKMRYVLGLSPPTVVQRISPALKKEICKKDNVIYIGMSRWFSVSFTGLPCALYTVPAPEVVNPGPVAAAFPNNSSLIHQFNWVVRRIYSRGQIERRIAAKYASWDNVAKMVENDAVLKGKSPVSMDRLWVSWYLVFSGWLVAVIAFGIELTFRRCFSIRDSAFAEIIRSMMKGFV